jgi:putative transposase
MERTYKFRLYPKREQVDALDRTLTLCCHLYNAGLEQRITAYARQEKTLNYYDQANELPEVKNELPEYTEVYSHALQDVIKRLDKAYANFFRRVKQGGEEPGFPRFKSSNRFRSVTFDRYGFRLRENGNLYATGIGTIRMFKHREIEGTPKTCIIKRDKVGDWYATLTATIPDVPKREPKTAIGVDVGLKSLAMLSTGERIEPPKFLRASEDKIKIVQREVSRKVKGSNNRRKCVRRLAKAHRRVERQRDDFLHKASRNLSLKADTIVFENLQIQNMVKNHHFAKSIGDAGWGKLMQYTAYKVEETGRSVAYVNPNGTSQICSRCGTMVRKSLSVRVHACPKCEFSADRDLNASFNILQRLHTDSVELYKTPAETVPPQLLTGGCEHGR